MFMDIKTLIAVLIPSVLSSIIALLNIYLNYKKAKEPPKDEVWEATIKLICTRQSELSTITAGDDFAKLYEQLKWFKDNGCQVPPDSSHLSSAFSKAKGSTNKHSPN